MKYIVYVLVDPRNGEVRYVGKSSQGLIRPRYHLLPSVYNKKTTRLYVWIRGLIENGFEPQIEIIEECESNELALAAERYHICKYKNEEARLLNLTSGGQGPLGRKVPEEVKLRLSLLYRGRKLTQGQKEKIRAKKLGQRLTEEQKKNLRLCSSRRKPLVCVETGEEYLSSREAAQKLKADHKTILKCCYNSKKTYRNLHFKFIERTKHGH